MTEETTKSKKQGKYYYAVGKRKTSIASVRLYSGNESEITVNDKNIKEYFKVKHLLDAIYAPLKLTDTRNKFHIAIKVKGGGITGQAEAIRHGITKGLIEFNEFLRPTLKKAGFLTRDARVKERKKYGLKKARRAPQFSKR